MMNLYGAWFRPLAVSRRPVGDLFYRVLFGAAGLNPLPYRIACYALLCANLGLLYILCRKLSASREVAALACLLGAYLAHLADLYYSTDTVYDLLCFLFYFLAFICYAEVCSRAWPWRTLVLTLYLVALGAKEMAVTLPVFLALYDLIYDPPAPNLAATRAWTGRELRRLSPFAVVTVGYILLKTVGPGRVTANSDFLPRVSWQVLIDGWKHYAFDLFYGAIAFTGPRVVLLWAVLLAIVLALRKRDLLFALCVILIGILPVVLIPDRGFYAVYLTLPGWYLLAARSLTTARHRLLPRAGAAAPAILFLLVAACLVPLHLRQKPRGNGWVAEAHESVRCTLPPLRYYDVPRAASASATKTSRCVTSRAHPPLPPARSTTASSPTPTSSSPCSHPPARPLAHPQAVFSALNRIPQPANSLRRSNWTCFRYSEGCMQLADFDYHLPEERIAQEALADRSASRMLVVHRHEDRWEDRAFRDLPGYLHPGDCLVLNDSRVFPARLFGHREGIHALPIGKNNPKIREHLSGAVEVFLLRSVSPGGRDLQALVRPGRKLPVGERITFAEWLEGEIVARGEFGERTVRFHGASDLYAAFERIGHVPLPPNIKRADSPADP